MSLPEHVNVPLTGTLPLAVIGTGLIGRKHIALIEENRRLSLHATVNPSVGSVFQAGDREVPNFCSHLDLIAAGGVAGAIVASPNETHAQIAVDLIAAGIPVLVEKPVAGEVSDGLRIVAAADRHGVPVLMGHHRRYNPLVGEMTQLVQSGELGALVGVSGVWSVFKPDPYYDAAWRTGPSGGPIMINLIHEIDYLHAIAGPITGVAALSGPKRRSHAGEEAVGVLFRFESGAIGSFMLSDSASSPWTWEQATGENHPVFPMNAESPYRFLFANGAVEFPSVRVWRQEAVSWEMPFRAEDARHLGRPMREVFMSQLDHFHDVISGSAQPLVTARQGLEALNVAMSVKRAISAGGAFIDVPEIVYDK